MNAEQLIARMLEQRAHWAPLPGGRRVRFHRPPELDMPKLLGGVRLEHVVEYACGWEGFTEATFLGAAVGSSDPLPFNRDVWAAWVADNADAVGPVAQAIAEAVTQHLQSREAVAKNSPPSST